MEEKEEDDPAIAEETVWDISGWMCEMMEAIRSDWESEDPEEEDDPEEDDDPEEKADPEDDDPDVCCPATADVTVCEIRGCICDTTDDTMSD